MGVREELSAVADRYPGSVFAVGLRKTLARMGRHYSIVGENRMKPFNTISRENIGTNIADRMKVIPWGQTAPNEGSRFTQDYRRYLNNGSALSLKLRRQIGEGVSAASTIIADYASSEADLREAFLQISVSLERMIVQDMHREREMRRLQAELSALKSGRA